MKNLITDSIDIWTGAQTPKINGGRGKKSNGQALYGIKKLRTLILGLAVRGKLVPQNLNDEPASVLLEKVAEEKKRLILDGKIKKQKKLSKIKEDEKTFDLPKGWEWVKLGQLMEMFNGRAFKPTEWDTKGLPIIRIQNLNNPTASYNYFNGKVAKQHLIENGTFLISWSGTPGTSFGAFIWTQGTAALNQHINKCMIFNEKSNFEFLRLSVNSCMGHLISKAQGAVGLKHVTMKTLNNVVFAFPPLAEQHRIVTKVDNLMALCDQLEQKQADSHITHQTLFETMLKTLTDAESRQDFELAWECIAQHFDILFTTEQSIDLLQKTILQLAVMGKLVPQGPDDEPSGVLLKKIADEKAQLIKEGKIKKQNKLSEISDDEKAFELPEGWAWSRMTSLMDANRGISYGIIKLGKEPKEGGIPTLRCSDVKNRYIDINFVRTVSPEIEKQYKRTRLKGGEVLINVRGTLGGVALVPSELDGYNIAREVAILPIYKELNGLFIVNLIASPFFWKMIQDNLRGMAYKGLNLKILGELVIPLPPLSEQNRIVVKVNALMALCDTLKARLRDTQTTQVQLADALVEREVG